MRNYIFIMIIVCSVSVYGQTEITIKNLPVGMEQYPSPIEGHDNLIRVYKGIGDKTFYGVYDINGKEVVPCVYLNLFTWEYGISVQGEDGKWGAIDYEGNIILSPIYSTHIYLSGSNDYHAINLGGLSKKDNFEAEGGKWGIHDRYGKIIVPCNYDGIQEVGNGVFAINQGGISTEGRASIYNIKGGKWGLYGNGKELIPCIYDEAPRFINGVAMVKKDGEVKLIKNPIDDALQVQIAENAHSSSKKKAGGSAVSRYPAPNSDVDKDIPAGKQSNENTFAFIIANENYPDAPVPYALNDGRIFKEYCNKTLGIPEKNISLYEDATFGNIITVMEKMKDLADAFDGEASVILYYAGHGFPDEKQSTAYLLPVDGNASDITTTGYSLAKLYKDLASLKLKSSVVFLDACFSGAKREDNMLASSRGVAIKVKEETPTGNMVVFSAAQGDETAHQMEEKGHGLFTYYLLKELQQTNGDVTLGALAEYVTKQVKRQSVVINNKKQTPTVVPSESLLNSWQDKKLK